MKLAYNNHQNKMKAEVKWNIGEFSVALQAEFGEQVYEALARYGLKYIAQRQHIDRTLGVLVKKGDKWVQSGTKRGDVPFSEGKAMALAELFEGMTIEGDEEEAEPILFDSIVAVVGQNTKESAANKWKAEKEKIASKEGDAAKLLALAKAVGFEESDASKLTVDNIAFCAAIRAWVKAQLAAV